MPKPKKVFALKPKNKIQTKQKYSFSKLKKAFEKGNLTMQKINQLNLLKNLSSEQKKELHELELKNKSKKKKKNSKKKELKKRNTLKKFK